MNVWMGYQNNPETVDVNAGFQSFRKLTAIGGQTPGTGFVFGPAMAMVFVDEKNNSVDDGEFLVQETLNNQMANIPASYHAGSGGVTFADGHVEMHPWKTATVLLPPAPSGVVNWNTGAGKTQFVNCIPTNQDLLWMQQHMSYSVKNGVLPGS